VPGYDAPISAREALYIAPELHYVAVTHVGWTVPSASMSVSTKPSTEVALAGAGEQTRAGRAALGADRARGGGQGDRRSSSALVHVSPLRYAGIVFIVRVKRPQSIVGRLWNQVQDVSAFVTPTFIVLKLTGVITWSWWWVLSPLWISGILFAVVLCALLVLLFWAGSRYARLLMDQHLADFLRDFAPGKSYPDTSGGDLGFPDGGGQGASSPDG